jgi:hypothetical protein
MTDPPPEPEPEEVATLGDLDLPAAVLREFVHRSGALRVSALLDRGEDTPPAVVETGRLAPVLATEGQRVRRMAHTQEVAVALPALPEVRQLPAMDVNAETGQVTGVLGGLEHLAGALRALAEILGGRTAVAAEFESTDPDTPLGLVARQGEAVTIMLGDEAFALEL